jgi:hypothetical protein
MYHDLTPQERKQWAKDLFTRLDRTSRQIAATVNVDEATVRGWINEGGWEGFKQSLRISRKSILERYYAMLEDLHTKTLGPDGEYNSKYLDQANKITAAIQNLERDDAVCQIIEVAEMFTNWLLCKDPGFCRQVTAQLDAFIRYKLSA